MQRSRAPVSRFNYPKYNNGEIYNAKSNNWDSITIEILSSELINNRYVYTVKFTKELTYKRTQEMKDLQGYYRLDPTEFKDFKDHPTIGKVFKIANMLGSEPETSITVTIEGVGSPDGSGNGQVYLVYSSHVVEISKITENSLKNIWELIPQKPNPLAKTPGAGRKRKSKRSKKSQRRKRSIKRYHG